jgi:hypothetical protein
MALRQSDGGLVWHKQFAHGTLNHGREPALRLRTEGELAAVQIGGGRLIGFRARGGQIIWEYLGPSGSIDEAEAGDSEGFSIADGVVYCLMSDARLAAIDLQSGNVKWRRGQKSRGTSSMPYVSGDAVIARVDFEWVVVDRFTGKTLWFGQPRPGTSLLRPAGGEGPLLFMGSVDRLIGRPSARSVSVPSMDTLLALDPRSGGCRWRWESTAGIRIRRALTCGEQLVVSDDNEFFGLAPGGPPVLPQMLSARQQLAEEDVAKVYGLRRGGPRVQYPPTDTQRDEACLELVRLGTASIAPLMARVRHVLEEGERRLPEPTPASGFPGRGWRQAGSELDLLVDIGDRASAIELATWCDRVRNRSSRDDLAEALIRFGEARAGGALFRYAQTGESDSLRRAALWVACRCSEQPGLQQGDVTRYLMAQLQDGGAALWLRRFAQFELLDGRGDAARRAALATFKEERTARLIPEELTQDPRYKVIGSYPAGFLPIAECRDEQGTCWVAATSLLLATRNEHLWILQSRDHQVWTKPAFAFDPRPQMDRVDSGTLKCASGILKLDFAGEKWIPSILAPTPARGHFEVSLADLYRDTDGDGLTDRLERQIGTDPHNPDSNGNGIPDGQDKNPLARRHRVSDPEAIYQAAIEALCQLGRTRPREFTGTVMEDSPVLLGSQATPLLLPAPPGSPDVEIRGHPGVVFCSSRIEPRSLPGWLVATGAGHGGFTPPHIGVDGVGRSDGFGDGYLDKPRGDPFEKPQHRGAYAPPAFNEWFPYERSTDGNRARVGWEDDYLFGGAGNSFDIEVRKIGGRWYPVECRQLSWWRSDSLPAPVRRVGRG